MKVFYAIYGTLIAIAVVLIMLPLIFPVDHTFFGATVNSNYIIHFDGKMKCAYITGWHPERKCMCFLMEYDSRLGNDKTLIASMPNACESQDDEAIPE